MILALAIAALAAQPAPPAGVDAGTAWELLLEEPAGQILLDPVSIARDGDIVRVRVKTVDARPNASFSYAIMRMAIDCPGRRDAIEGGASFTRDGRVINSRALEPGEALEWVPIETGSASDLYHRRACGAAGARR